MTTFRSSGKLQRRLVLLLVPLLMAGCTRAPSVDILGSFFPAWLVCFMLALVLTACLRWAVARLHFKVAFPILVYASLAALFTFALWLILFY